MLEKVHRNGFPKVILKGSSVEVEKLLRGLNWKPRVISDLEPAKPAFKDISVRIHPLELSRPKIEDLAAAIFGRTLNAGDLKKTAEAVEVIMNKIGFSDQIDLSAEAAILPAIADSWTEIGKAMDCPDKVIRFPIISYTDDVPHTICRHRDDYALIKIRYSVVKSGDVEAIGKEILSALKQANEIIFIRFDDKRLKRDLAAMYLSEGKRDSEINPFFEKDGVTIRYSSRVSPVRTAFIYNNLDVRKISKSLKEKGFERPILGLMVDYCADDHPSFIKFDPQTGLVLVVLSDRINVSEEILEGIFKNIIPTKIELWEGSERLTGVEYQFENGDQAGFGVFDVIKAVTALHNKPRLEGHRSKRAHPTD